MTAWVDGPRADAQVTVVEDMQNRPEAWTTGTEAVQPYEETVGQWGRISRDAAQRQLELHGDDGQGFWFGHNGAETVSAGDVLGWLGYAGNPAEYDRATEWQTELDGPRHDADEASI